MHRFIARGISLLPTFVLFASFMVQAQTAGAQSSGSEPETAVTIYNANFAVVRQNLKLDLQSGINQTTYSGITAQVEPDSVVLRDPAGQRQLQILEQNYRNDPLSQALLLSLFEGKTLEFRRMRDGKPETVQGKVIRSGYVPRNAANPYGYNNELSQPIVEAEGRIVFGLPGEPLFPSLGENTILKPTLTWTLQTNVAGAFKAEISYITGGMDWDASYNVIAPEKGDVLDLAGWITMRNNSGKVFDNARIKLMAGDVSKLTSNTGRRDYDAVGQLAAKSAVEPVVREKAFDEFHLYTLERPVTLLDRETKQVEFVSAHNVKARRLYIYDGAQIPNYGWSDENIRNSPDYGTQMNKKVWVMQEFKNTKINGLGIALPKGRLRFYRRDNDGQLEFTGENLIEHTLADETIRVYTGNAFDLVGERKRIDYHVESARRWLDESFEIRLRNHKKEPVEMRVVEHLYRWSNWDVSQKSDTFRKIDSRTIEFPVTVPPDGEKVVTYTVHYSW
ncbi:MAG: hypothetical protein LAP21_11165 [Acidobacteriia bacterium]|nr:hypothetical protein [Terriglobia bacterium]